MVSVGYQGVLLPKSRIIRLILQRFLKAVLVLSVVILAISTSPAEAAHRKRHHVARAPVDRFSEIVIEASTGYVLSERNADKRLYPASLTKMMTLYLTFDAIDKGALKKSQYIRISKRAASQEPSSLGLAPGDTIRVEDAILAIVTKSANDCAVALAEAVGGSEDKFAYYMTLKARQLGMNNTRFVNASGLFNPSQMSSARDMSLLAQAIIRDHAKDYHYFSTAEFTYAGNSYSNHNKLMSYYRGMDGFKTGYVYASGYNLTASAVRGGTRLIGVVFGGKTARSRNDAMAKLLDQSFERMSNIRVADLVTKKHAPALPARKPEPAAIEVAAAVPIPAPALQFNAMGLVVEQGDTDIGTDVGEDASPITAVEKTASAGPVANFHPRPMNTATLETPKQKQQEPPQKPEAPVQTASTGGEGGSWAIQIGAYSSHDAGMRAIERAKTLLPATPSGFDAIAPLMTNRGMIYRAQLSGLARNDAAKACRILKGNCLILSIE